MPKGKVKYEDAVLPYVLRKNYVPDFVITKRDGSTIYIEVKGWLRPQDRTKLRAVKELNPTLDIRLVFAKDNKISKGSKTTYSMWATKYGFPYCIETIPKEWFNGSR